MARTYKQDADINLTPMIDVVFQLIIFFIVTIQLEEQINEEIELQTAPHAPIIESEDPRTLVVEVAENGRISIHDRPITLDQLNGIVVGRMNRYRSEFPVMIRADKNARHEYVRNVMDVVSGAGLWRINFVAIQERRVAD